MTESAERGERYPRPLAPIAGPIPAVKVEGVKPDIVERHGVPLHRIFRMREPAPL